MDSTNDNTQPEQLKGCGKNINRMNCPNFFCGEDGQLCKECEPKEESKESELKENFAEIKEGLGELVGEENIFGLTPAPLIPGLPTINLEFNNPQLFDEGLEM